MQLVCKVVFALAVIAICWLAMMAVHELGHVVGAIATGGTIERVVLYPLSISQTDVSPNPNPLVVVWLGPILGCLIPVAIWSLIPTKMSTVKSIVSFFVGFCLIANGCYIAVGSFFRTGDCDVMLLSGSPFWTLVTFGILTVPVGLWVWHLMGSPVQFLKKTTAVDSVAVVGCVAVLALILVLEFWLSPV